MEKQEPKYGLRTRKSEFKGKYREMLGANSTPVLANADRKVQVKEEDSQTLQDSEKERKILVVPIVVSDGGDILTENAIEIEISEDGTISTLCEDGDKPARIPDSAKKVGDPLDHIEEILKQNNQLIQSIPEAPSFKKRKLTDKIESQLSVLNDQSEEDEDSLSDETIETSTHPMNNILVLSAEVVQNMSLRPLTEAEQQLIKNLLKEDKKDIVLQTFFGAEVESRVRKCSICCCLIEGSDAVYASHYTETHECDPTFSCELCDQVSVESTVYFSHIQSHFMAKPKKSTIKSGNSKNDAMGEPFVCDICGKTLKHQKSLYSHRRTHTDAKAVCHICGATLKSSRYLHHHLLLHKDIDKPHKCEKCGKAFFSSSALKVHHYYNHEEHPGRFQCTVCGKTFKAKQGLQFHMDSHSNELRYECSYCQKKFRGFKTCRVHELRHREANEPNKFSCNVCGKLFKTRQTLKNHEDVHASFNRYQCSLCEKRFKLRKSCLAHIRVHHNDQDSANANTAVNDEGEMAVESLLADGEEYVVTLEDNGEVQRVLFQDGQEQSVELVVPEAHVECEVANVT